MKIVRVDSFLMSCPLPEPLKLPFYGGLRTILKRDAMLIRIETANGLVGWAPGPGSEKIRDAILHSIAPFLVGRTLADTDALRVLFSQGPALGKPGLLKAYGTVEIAMFDLLGKAFGVPVSEIAGGRVRDRILLYGSAGMYMEPIEYAEEAGRVADLGYRGYKMRAGCGPERDVEAVRLTRESLGDSIDLMVDAHTWLRMGNRNYTPDTVRQVAAAMAEHDILWLEEPLPPHDHAAYLKLKDEALVPLASGEHEPDEAGFLDLIFHQAVNYIQMDVCCQGGFSLAKRVLAEVQKEGLRFAFHSWGTDLEVLAAGHLGICFPETVTAWLEAPVYAEGVLYPFPLATEILKDPLPIRNGELEIPREPGLGVEIDDSVIHRYPWVPGPWSYFEIETPPSRLAVTSDHSVMWDEA